MDNLVFHPELRMHPSDNEQTIEMTKIFSKKYNVVSLEWFLKHPLDKKNKIIYLNWYENIIGGGNCLLQIINYLIKWLILIFCKARRIKIVYAVHNKTPHGVDSKSRLYKNLIKPFMIRALNLADIIVIHSRKTSDFIKYEYGINDIWKIKYIPIGKTSGMLGDRMPDEIHRKLKIDKNVLLLGYVGRLTRYKQIENAIVAFEELDIPARLFIVGSADKDYQVDINKKIHSNKVFIEYRYVEDEEMNNYIREMDAMILPYDYSCLNSGPMLQAFLNGTNVIGTAIGTVYDFPLNLTYVYDYRTEEEHIEKLKNGIISVYCDKISGDLDKKNVQLQECILKNNKWSDIEILVNKHIM